jgi:hypothetical protein
MIVNLILTWICDRTTSTFEVIESGRDKADEINIIGNLYNLNKLCFSSLEGISLENYLCQQNDEECVLRCGDLPTPLEIMYENYTLSPWMKLLQRPVGFLLKSILPPSPWLNDIALWGSKYLLKTNDNMIENNKIKLYLTLNPMFNIITSASLDPWQLTFYDRRSKHTKYYLVLYVFKNEQQSINLQLAGILLESVQYKIIEQTELIMKMLPTNYDRNLGELKKIIGTL